MLLLLFFFQICYFKNELKSFKKHHKDNVDGVFLTESNYQYEMTINNNISLKIANLTINIKNFDNNETIILQSGDTYWYSSNNSFQIQVTLKTAYCNSRTIKTYMFSDPTTTNLTYFIDDNLIPNACIPYEICIHQNSSSNYPLRYSKRNLSNVIIETNEFKGELKLFDSFNFSVEIYSNDKTCDNISIYRKSAAKKIIQCDEITNEIIPDFCKNDYYRIFIDLSGIKYYRRYFVYRFTTAENYHNFTNNEDLFKFALSEPFSIEIAFNFTPGCSFYQPNITYNAKLNLIAETVILNDSMVPKICLDTLYWIFIQNSITLEGVKLYIKNRFDNYIEIDQNGVYNDSNTFEFEYSLFITTSKCRERVFLCYRKSRYMNYNAQIIDNSLVQDDCLDEKFVICFDFSGLPNKYSIGYIRDDDPNKNIFPVHAAKEVLESKKPFSLEIYLTSSPFCENELILLESLNSKLFHFSSCIFYNEKIIPKRCREDYNQTESEIYTQKISNVKSLSEIFTTKPDMKTLSAIISQTQENPDSSENSEISNRNKIIIVAVVIITSISVIVIIVIVCLVMFIKNKQGKNIELNSNTSSMQKNLLISENIF